MNDQLEAQSKLEAIDRLPEPDALPSYRVDVHHLRWGQRRAYADSDREVLLIFANWWDSTTGKRRGTWEPKPEQVKVIAQTLLGMTWKEEGEPRHFADRYLKAFGKVAPGVWHIHIIEPYTD